MPVGRRFRIVGACTIAVGAFAFWWFGGPRSALYGSSPGTHRARATSTPTTHGSSAPGHREPLVARGDALGADWTLTSSTEDGSVCLSLSRSGVSIDSGTCWQAEHGLIEVLRASAPGGELWFGPAPRETARIWVALEDGRMAFGNVYRLPQRAGPSSAAFVIDVPRPLAFGTVIAVGTRGRMVGQAHAAAFLDPGEAVAALDVHGNVIGYVSSGTGLALLTPGRHAPTTDVRSFARYALHRIPPTVRSWWDARPPADARDAAFERWWVAYPIDDQGRRSPASR